MSDYPVIPELPEVPVRNEAKADFSRKSSEFISALPALRTAINTAGAWIQTTIDNLADYLGLTEQARDDAILARNTAQGYASTANDKAGESESWAASSQNYANMAAATAAFKGEWSSLSGALAVPASVYHSGQFWQLLRNVPDVTASEPGVSADWVSPYSQASKAWVPISGNVTLTANVPYAVLFSGAGQVLTLPPSPSANDTVEIASRGGDSTGVVIARNGSTIHGAADDVTIDDEITGLRLIYLNSTWRFVQ